MSNVTTRLAEIPQDFPQIYKIRYLVFQIEQGVDPILEFDGQDEQAQHILTYLDGKPVGTARIRFWDDRTAKVERVAVLAEVRGQGIGRTLMEYILNLLAEKHVVEVAMNAQESVIEFYEKLGFTSEGELFEEAGIPHIKMRKLLQ
ncbi:MAG: GNAT family N-acetyltransferase [Leptolyngbyaceae cyanobacterium RU_5_1]|nr:GNAT family N-acetyltransferase [Leptolyngbyaceae cyanobacterium RU_5_1]